MFAVILFKKKKQKNKNLNMKTPLDSLLSSAVFICDAALIRVRQRTLRVKLCPQWKQFAATREPRTIENE